MLLAGFLVEIEDEDPKPQADLGKTARVRRFSVVSNSPEEEIPQDNCINPFCIPIVKTRPCICLMIYGFFHYAGMIGVVVFLPTLLTESFMPLITLDLDAMKEGQVTSNCNT